jgi:hypothetical protein
VYNKCKRDAPSFRILDGADNDWFDIDDDELTFKATAFRAQKDNMLWEQNSLLWGKKFSLLRQTSSYF